MIVLRAAARSASLDRSLVRTTWRVRSQFDVAIADESTACLVDDSKDVPSGYGLYLVDLYSSAWGVSATEGTCVWFELPLRDEQQGAA